MSFPPRLNQDLLERIRLVADELSASLPEAFDIASLSTKAKLPFKALTLRESLIHRASELADTALDLIDSRRFIPATIIARALMETTGLLYWLHHRVESAVKAGQVGDLDDFLMRGLVGDKLDDGEDDIVALNAMSGIDRVSQDEKDLPVTFREMYDWLCEFTHPNWGGVMGAYSKVDRQNWRVTFGSRRDPKDWEFLEAPLHRSLWVFRDRYNDMARFFPAFIALCEEDLESQDT